MLTVILMVIALLAHTSHSQEEVKRVGAELVRMVASAMDRGPEEFPPKRSLPTVHLIPPVPPDILILPTKRDVVDDFHWKNRMDAEFLGKRATVLQQLQAKRRLGNKFLGMRGKKFGSENEDGGFFVI